MHILITYRNVYTWQCIWSFQPPEPAERWEGIRDGREFGPRCLQLDSFMGVIQGEEDCLTINVFSPVVEVRKTGL